MQVLTASIESYTKDDIHGFVVSVHDKAHRSAKHCFTILKNVFANSAERGIIPKNPIATLKAPSDKGKAKRGEWFNPSEQKVIKDIWSD